jgi:hypothetical protein
MTTLLHTKSQHTARALVGAFILGSLAAAPAGAQPSAAGAPPTGDQVLVSRHVQNGGYGGPDVRFTRLTGDFAVLIGARGGWIINHSFRLGAAGYGSASRRLPAGYTLPSGRAAGLEFGYGGVDFGWVSQPSRLVHLTLGTLVGGGAVGYNDPAHRDEGWTGPRDGFFVVEPAAEAELNVTRNVRVGVGGSYRFVTGARLASVRNADLSGPAGTLTVRFGRF